MTMRPLASSILLAASTLLASCSGTLTCGNSHPYGANVPRPPLAAPPGVTVPVPDPAYIVPAGSTKPTAAPAATTGPLAQHCLVTPPNVLTPTDVRKVAPAAATGSKPQPAPAVATKPRPNVAAGGPLE